MSRIGSIFPCWRCVLLVFFRICCFVVHEFQQSTVVSVPQLDCCLLIVSVLCINCFCICGFFHGFGYMTKNRR